MNSNSYLFQEILAKNPVLVATVGLCPVVAICTSLKAALILSVITILTLIFAQLITSLFLKLLPQWVRLGLYTLISMIIVVPSMLFVQKISPETMLALGIYFPLLAVNPLIVRNCEREAIDASVLTSIGTSICAGLGYSIVLIIVGIIRELLGSGTIWGVHVSPFEPAEAMLMPVGGFIIIAFLAAILRAYFRKVDPEFADQLIANDRTNIKGSKKAKLALKGAKYADGSVAAPRVKKSKKELRHERQQVEPRNKIQVMTLEEAEEQRAQNLPPVETTLQVELAPTDVEDYANDEPSFEIPNEIPRETIQEYDPDPTMATATDKTSRFEFITLDLNKDNTTADQRKYAKAVEESRREKPQKQKTKRGQTRKVKSEEETDK